MPRIRTRPTNKRSSRRQRRVLGERLTKALILGGAFACLWYDTGLHAKLLQFRRQAVALTVLKEDAGDTTTATTTTTTTTSPPRLSRGYNASTPLRIAFVGNSILYYNDCPGLLLAMMKTAQIYHVEAEACLKSGSSLSTIPQWGCEPHRRFDKTRDLSIDVLLQENWDFVVFQDQTMVPSVDQMRRDSLYALEEVFAAPIKRTGATPVFLQTAGYAPPRQAVPMYEPMTKRLSEGYHAYAELMTQRLSYQARVAPAGDAYASIYRNTTTSSSKLWQRLYADDGTHPSALGTYLIACVLYITIVGEDPPFYNSDWWMGPWNRKRTHFPLPTPEEAEVLRRVAVALAKEEWEGKKDVLEEG